MGGRATGLAAVALLAVAGFGSAHGVAGPPVPEGATSWNGWQSLRLKARKMLFFTGSIEMRLTQRGESRVLETDTHARFFGATLTRSSTATRIDPKTGRTLEYVSRSPKRGRHYVFGPDGYTVKKLSPTAGHEAPIERWAVDSEQFYPYPAAPEGRPRPVVHDYYGMILRIGEAGLDRPGDQQVFHVATSRGVKAYRVRVSEQRVATRSFHDRRHAGRRKAEVRELRLRITPEHPDERDEGFLNMEGETELWVEADSGTLLEIAGKIPKVPGRVEIELDAID